mmetsp:Transcript_6253/g.14762  ORF Transcript_6253/g.14762 Transcript_6253/m.14762 type:complete len:206 (-) Transcript_6253:355-972(-)
MVVASLLDKPRDVRGIGVLAGLPRPVATLGKGNDPADDVPELELASEGEALVAGPHAHAGHAVVVAKPGVLGRVVDRHRQDVLQVGGNVRDRDLWLLVGRVQDEDVEGVLRVAGFVGVVLEPLEGAPLADGLLGGLLRVSREAVAAGPATGLAPEVFPRGGIDHRGREGTEGAAVYPAGNHRRRCDGRVGDPVRESVADGCRERG